MEINEQQNRILNLYLEQELLLAELYAMLAEKFPEHKEFWLGLVSEEREHAAWLKKLHEDASAGKLTFSEGKTRSNSLEIYNKYLKGIVDQAKAPGFTMQKALSVSIDVENSLIESKVFTHFEGDSTQLRTTLRILWEATAHHVAHVKEYAAVAGLAIKP